ncbi:MAG: TIGR03016 family PEP-CTERM system-associated outer membrane protein [Candidatus Nitrotoga sp.]|nr:TIGR03016 family PEP-CTERM system-associated outer membrane protein [Candidatus Nitrotoga sp.]
MTKVAKNNRFYKLFCKIIWTAAATVLIYPAYSAAADWKVTPRLNLMETYTDNVTLATRGNERSDFITQINPGLSLIGTGARLKVNVNYTMQNLFYANESNSNRTVHQLRAGEKAELIKNFLFLDSSANISQQNISLLGPLATNNENITNNRTTIKTYSISPYIRHNFSNFASTQARYTHNAVYTGIGGLSSSQSDSILLTLASGSAFRTLGWGLNYNKQKIDGLGPSVANERYMGNLRYRVSSKFSLTGTSGYEKFGYASAIGLSAGSFWTTGFIWTPSERTNITANAGKRFFGNTYTLMAKHRTRRSAWSLNYNQNITTTRDQFVIPATVDTANFLDQLWASNIPDPVMRQQTIDAFIRDNGLSASIFDPINVLTNQFFLQKRLQGSVALSGARSTLVFSIFHMLREAQTQGDANSALFGVNNFTLNNDTKQIGGNALWSWKISPRTNANIGAIYIKSNILATGQEDETKTFRVGLTRQIQPKLNGAVNFRHTERTSNQIGSEYRENAIVASLLMSF